MTDKTKRDEKGRFAATLRAKLLETTKALDDELRSQGVRVRAYWRQRPQDDQQPELF